MRKKTRYFVRRQLLRIAVVRGKKIKIIVGAAETYQRGWLATNEQWLDITNKKDWDNVFQGKKIVTHVVAEHVFEHLSEDDMKKSLHLIQNILVPNGHIRIAVPDGNNPHTEYIEHVQINGIGADASDHKQLLTFEKLKSLLETSGFTPTLIEGYADNRLVMNTWSNSEGYIRCSRQNKEHVCNDPQWDFIDANTSLIIDGVART